MLVTTSAIEQSKLEQTKQKALRLCKLNKCGLIDLIILSIDIEAENKKLKNK